MKIDLRPKQLAKLPLALADDKNFTWSEDGKERVPVVTMKSCSPDVGTQELIIYRVTLEVPETCTDNSSGEIKVGPTPLAYLTNIFDALGIFPLVMAHSLLSDAPPAAKRRKFRLSAEEAGRRE